MSRYYSSVKHRKWQRHYHLDEQEVDPVVAAATAHLNSPVVLNFVNKASLSASLIYGTASPSMSLGSFASGASGFPFNNDAVVDTGVGNTGVAGEFMAVYMTDIDGSTDGFAIFIGHNINGGMNIRHANATTLRWYYGDSTSTSSPFSDGTYVNSAGTCRVNNSGVASLSFSSDTGGRNIYIGGYSTTRACTCNMVYAVYAPSIATSAAAAASAIHSAMVAGAP